MEFLINSRVISIASKLSPLLLVIIIFALLLKEQQSRKDTLYELFQDAQASTIENKAWFYEQLKDIDCSLSKVPNSDKEELHIYLKIYKESINEFLKENYVSDETKYRLKKSLKYIPYKCKET